MFYTSLEEHETVAFLKVEIMTQEDFDKTRWWGTSYSLKTVFTTDYYSIFYR